jgi:predicted RNA-binding protein with PUA-like domain
VGYWLFKQEPSSYSYSQLEADGRTVWEGVTNNLALKHLRSVKEGDKAFFYHTGDEKRIVGLMEIASPPYADPRDDALTVVDVRPLSKLPRAVSLQMIKSDKSFSEWELVKISRLSVMPVPEPLWKKILKMSGM